MNYRQTHTISKIPRLLATLSVILSTHLFSTNVFANPVSSCDAPVSIPDEGVTINLLQGGQKHRYLDVNINGQQARAVVDTGGMGIGGLVSESFLARLSLENDKLKKMTAHGAHGASESKSVTIDSTQIGAASVDNLMFMSTKEAVMKDDNAPVLIGSRFLCQFITTFDFSHNLLGLYNRKTDINKVLDQTRAWTKIPFTNFYNTGGVIFDFELNGKPIKAALDTGSPFTGINWQAAALAGIDKNSTALHRYEALPHGLNATGSTWVNESTFELSLSGGKLTRTDNAVRINDIHAFKQLFGDKPGMILGLPFFEKRKVVIDYGKSVLYISQK